MQRSLEKKGEGTLDELTKQWKMTIDYDDYHEEKFEQKGADKNE